jgi:hypothetical protein
MAVTSKKKKGGLKIKLLGEAAKKRCYHQRFDYF